MNTFVNFKRDTDAAFTAKAPVAAAQPLVVSTKALDVTAKPVDADMDKLYTAAGVILNPFMKAFADNNNVMSRAVVLEGVGRLFKTFAPLLGAALDARRAGIRVCSYALL